MSSDPPPYGFHPNYIPPGKPMTAQDSSSQYAHNNYGAELSYPMPIPGQNTNTPPPSQPPPPPTTTTTTTTTTPTYPQPLEIITRSSSESSSSSSNCSSNESSCDSYHPDYTQYPPIGYSWQPLTADDPFPHQNAVRAGKDADGSNIYVGRALYNGDMLPAKVIPDKNAAYISYDGEEIEKDEYEILRRGDFVWEFAKDGEIPIGAVQIGRTADGEILYMGRCLYQGTQTPGKVHPSHNCLYIPFDGEEISISEYEVLVVK